MAIAVTGLRPCALTVNLFSGARTPFPATPDVLVTVIDGNQNVVHRDFHNASTIIFQDLPFHDNFGDNYTVVASADGYSQAGVTPVKVSRRFNAVADIMLTKADGGFNFADARWDRLSLTHAEFARVLASGDTYTETLENHPKVLACLLNLFTAMEQIHLPDRTPLHYLNELIWERAKQDRCYAWADRRLVEQVVRAAEDKSFAPEPASSLFHKGATRSYKQTQFGEANVQITFHENDVRATDESILVEVDIDYFRDQLAHALLEVAVNTLTHSLTEPRDVYVLRWMAGRRGGIPNFEPPYYLD